MLSIDRWVIRNVFSAMSDGCFCATPGEKRIISINLSGASLGNEQLLDYICTTSKELGISLDDFGSGLSSFAEWVENEETLTLLKKIGVNYAQGYHTGRPAPIYAPA